MQKNGSMIWKTVMESTLAEQQKGNKKLKNNYRLRDVWDNIKHTNISIIGVLEGEEEMKGVANLLEEKRAEQFPNLGKKTDTQV